MESRSQVIFLNPFPICSLRKQKFAVCPFLCEETNRSYPFANKLNLGRAVPAAPVLPSPPPLSSHLPPLRLGTTAPIFRLLAIPLRYINYFYPPPE